MYIIDERGNKVHIDNGQLPDQMKDWICANIQMVDDNFELEKCYVAQVCRRPFDSREKGWEFLGEKVYDHYPTKEELMWLLCEYQTPRNSYVSVTEAWRYHEVYD